MQLKEVASIAHDGDILGHECRREQQAGGVSRQGRKEVETADSIGFHLRQLQAGQFPQSQLNRGGRLSSVGRDNDLLGQLACGPQLQPEHVAHAHRDRQLLAHKRGGGGSE